MAFPFGELKCLYLKIPWLPYWYAKEAFPLATIQAILAGVDPAKPFTSARLQPAFVGRSQNQAGFALAILLAEGLVEIVSPDDRRFRCADGSQFFKAIEALISNGTNLPDDTPTIPAPVTPAAPKKSKKVAKPETAAAE